MSPTVSQISINENAETPFTFQDPCVAAAADDLPCRTLDNNYQQESTVQKQNKKSANYSGNLVRLEK